MTKIFTPRRWVLFTFIGWLLGIVFILLLSGLFDLVSIEGYQSYVGIGTGAGVGLMQWLTLRKNGGIGAFWLWYTVLGMGVPFVLTDVLQGFFNWQNKGYQLIFSVIAGGVLTGVLQATRVQPDSVKGRWILAASLGWLLSVFCVMMVDYVTPIIPHNLVGFFINLSLILSGGIVLGAVTAPVMMRICNTIHEKNSKDLSERAQVL